MSVGLGCLLAWVLGGIPFGLVLVRALTGKDLRTLGSGNVGATNASRAFSSRRRGFAVFLLIYVLDAAKGFVPAYWGPDLVQLAALGGPSDVDPVLVAVLMGAAAILGHCASPFLGLRGGKGVATATGALAALDVRALGVALAVFAVVFAATRRVYLGSLALGVGLAVAVVALEPSRALGSRLPITVLASAIAVFLFYTHRSNIRTALRARRAGSTTGGVS